MREMIDTMQCGCEWNNGTLFPCGTHMGRDASETAAWLLNRYGATAGTERVCVLFENCHPHNEPYAAELLGAFQIAVAEQGAT